MIAVAEQRGTLDLVDLVGLVGLVGLVAGIVAMFVGAGLLSIGIRGRAVIQTITPGGL